LKRLFRKVPGLAPAYHNGRVLLDVLHEGWLSNRRQRFDSLLANDVWDFEKPTTIERYERAMEAVGSFAGASWGDALELGCGIGVFTAMLSARCRSVLATDISEVGCERTRARCAGRDNLSVGILDLREDPINGSYDLVFAMDVLECIHGRASARAIADKIADALRNDGLLVITMSRLPAEMRQAWWARWLVEGGDVFTDFLDGKRGLRLVHRELYEKYLVAVLQKSA
jgi:SAM-dependent methyltransferase